MAAAVAGDGDWPISKVRMSFVRDLSQLVPLFPMVMTPTSSPCGWVCWGGVGVRVVSHIYDSRSGVQRHAVEVQTSYIKAFCR